MLGKGDMVSDNRLPKRTSSKIYFALILFVHILPYSLEQDEDIPHNDVKNWALKFGVDLWHIGKSCTRMNELQRKFNDVNINVARKDGLLLIREMAAEVKNMMDFKMGAVMRIMDSAEQAALTPQTDNGQPFKYYNAQRLNVFAPDGRPAYGTREMILTPNPHFDHLPVNTSISTILLPPGVSEEDSDVLNAIQWSEHLDPLFVNNYEGDPSLSWQFFGSSTGFLRRYPDGATVLIDLSSAVASYSRGHEIFDQQTLIRDCNTDDISQEQNNGIAWPPEDISTIWERPRNDRNVYDFRSSAWYINAATSPKDIVILVDNSASMDRARSTLARATVEAILDTLSDNDFVNVYKFSATTEESVPCTKDILIQANYENIQMLKDSLESFGAENTANFSSALVTGFEILHKYNRTGQGSQCNQAIMLITDGPPSSYKEIFKQYNFPHRPVRVFTYLIGKDASNAEEMHWMACSNKGYFSRIKTASEIKRKVLHYTEVMARPMVMYQNDHPIQWTSAYVGGKADSFDRSKKGQLMTTVTTPVFDRRNHSVRVANVLGVVGTDVSIDQIKKLIPAYKLGVNGYSFLVNNNGHVLYHPDLRPMLNNDLYQDTLKPQYVSVDLTEVELVENENAPRENHSVLLDLRHDMIEQKEGETEIAVKIHYDIMRRVATRRHKYFYKPIDGTPYSLGLAIPEGYGMLELLAEQEIKHSQKNVTDYFKGNNWRVHPDWVYCEYTNGESGEQWFRTAEERVLHFLSRSRRPGWKWMSVRPRSPLQREHHYTLTKHDRDAYFCDKTLLQSLVLDAKVTEELMQKRNSHSRETDNHGGYKIFGLTLSFVATRSGLLRWTDHDGKPEFNNQPHFSENNIRAMDETWYKRAVDQHSIEHESFVFSVPFDVGSTENTMITATHAVFVEHKGHKAPAAVVGVQYLHSTLSKHFINITSTCSGTSCNKTCTSNKLHCYILDNNGFIIISEKPEHTGRFFGQIDGTIMDSLVQDRIYKKIPVYDYQGVCSNSRGHFSADSTSIKPLKALDLVYNMVLKFVFYFFLNLEKVYGAAISYSEDDLMDIYSDYEYPTGEEGMEDHVPIAPPPPASNPASFTPPFESDPLDGVEMEQFGIRPCDKKVNLYVLQPDRLNTGGQSSPLKGKLTNCHVTGCERPFSVQKIPHSNLILLVVDTVCPCGSKQLSILPQEVVYDSGNGGCVQKSKDTLPRRRPSKCINYHPEEIEIHICGSATTPSLSAIYITVLFFHQLLLSLLSS